MNRETGKDTWKFPIEEDRKRKSLAVIGQAIEKRQIRLYPSFLENVWNQLRFQSWKYWCMQGSVLLAAILLSIYLVNTGKTGIDSIVRCSVFLVIAGNVCLSSLGRLFSWHMAELEQTLYLNLKQMVCIQLLSAGIVDVLVLGVIVGVTSTQAGVGTAAYLLYILVPFLWSDIVYLYLLTAMRRQPSGYLQLSVTAVCAVLALLPVFWEGVYQAAYLPVWGGLCLAGVLVLVVEIYKMLGKIERGEELCLN